MTEKPEENAKVKSKAKTMGTALVKLPEEEEENDEQGGCFALRSLAAADHQQPSSIPAAPQLILVRLQKWHSHEEQEMGRRRARDGALFATSSNIDIESRAVSSRSAHCC